MRLYLKENYFNEIFSGNMAANMIQGGIQHLLVSELVAQHIMNAAGSGNFRNIPIYAFVS